MARHRARIRPKISIEERKKKLQQQPHPVLDTGTYWWIWGVEDGKTVIIGAEYTEEDAWQRGYRDLKGNFKVIPLNTRNLAEATRRIKAMKLEETHNLGESLKYTRHQLRREV